MERYFGLADLYSKNSLHDVAYSALPDAPVQPYVEPRRHLRNVLARLRSPAKGRAVTVRPARFSTEC